MSEVIIIPINDNILDFAEGGSEGYHGIGKVDNVNLNKRITFLDMYLSHLNKSVSYPHFSFVLCLFSDITVFICSFAYCLKQCTD